MSLLSSIIRIHCSRDRVESTDRGKHMVNSIHCSRSSLVVVSHVYSISFQSLFLLLSSPPHPFHLLFISSHHPPLSPHHLSLSSHPSLLSCLYSFIMDHPCPPDLGTKSPEDRRVFANEPLREVAVEYLEPIRVIPHEWHRPTDAATFGLLDPPHVSEPQIPKSPIVIKAESLEPGEIVTPKPLPLPQGTTVTSTPGAPSNGSLKRRLEDVPADSPRPNPYLRYNAALSSRRRLVTYSSASPSATDSDEKLLMRVKHESTRSTFPSQSQDSVGITGSSGSSPTRGRVVCPSFIRPVELSYQVRGPIKGVVSFFFFFFFFGNAHVYMKV